MEINNNHPEKDYTNPVDSSNLSYARTVKVGDSVSIATNKKAAGNSQHVDNKIPALKRVPKLHGKDKDKQIEGDNTISSEHISNNMCNIQILYNEN